MGHDFDDDVIDDDDCQSLTLEDFDLEATEVLHIDDLKSNDWVEIKKIALSLYDANVFGRDQMKIAIRAFLIWLDYKEIAITTKELGDKQTKN